MNSVPWSTRIVDGNPISLRHFLVGATARQFVMVGICGGYITFLSFSLQTLNLVNSGEWLHAGGNIGLSVASGSLRSGQDTASPWRVYGRSRTAALVLRQRHPLHAGPVLGTT